MEEWDSEEDDLQENEEDFNEDYTLGEWNHLFTKQWQLLETPSELLIYDSDYHEIPFDKPIFDYLIKLHNNARQAIDEYVERERLLMIEIEKRENENNTPNITPLDESTDLPTNGYGYNDDQLHDK